MGMHWNTCLAADIPKRGLERRIGERLTVSLAQGYVLVPHPARRQASRRGEKSQVWLSRPPCMFFPFSSPIDLEAPMCRRSQELRKRQFENSPLLAILALCRETELGHRTPL